MSHPLLLPRQVDRELSGKRSSQDSKPSPLQQDVDIASGSLTGGTTMPGPSLPCLTKDYLFMRKINNRPNVTEESQARKLDVSIPRPHSPATSNPSQGARSPHPKHASNPTTSLYLPNTSLCHLPGRGTRGLPVPTPLTSSRQPQQRAFASSYISRGQARSLLNQPPELLTRKLRLSPGAPARRHLAGPLLPPQLLHCPRLLTSRPGLSGPLNHQAPRGTCCPLKLAGSASTLQASPKIISLAPTGTTLLFLKTYLCMGVHLLTANPATSQKSRCCPQARAPDSGHYLEEAVKRREGAFRSSTAGPLPQVHFTRNSPPTRGR